MSTLKVRDVLQQAHDLHERLARHYGELKQQATTERLRLLCEHMAGHEHTLAQALLRYMNDVSAHLLDAWLQYVPDDRALSACAVLSVPEPLEAETVLAAARHYDDCLKAMYQAMGEAAQHDDVRDAFANLAAMEEQEKHRHSLSLQSLYDW